MKIAILGSVALPVPPPAQGGTEWIAYYQAKGLASLGHKVILFAAKGSKKDNYELIEVGGGDTVQGSTLQEISKDGFVESSRKLRLENVYLAQVLQQLIDRKDDYDLILNNMRGEAVFLPAAKMLNKPFVNVMHLPLFDRLAEIFSDYKTRIITISNAQRRNFTRLNYLATVYNCVDTEKYEFDQSRGDYLLMMGSIAPHKNQAGAINVAKKLGMKLILAGKINDRKYFDSLKGDIDGKLISWIGELVFPEKLKLYQKAKAFLFPILWEEPFGLVMIEAMSCGTPVVAFGNGAIPEVVKDGESGFIIAPNLSDLSHLSNLQIKAKGEEGLIKAIETINRLSDEDYRKIRLACRKHIEDHFTVEKMVSDYEKALSRI